MKSVISILVAALSFSLLFSCKKHTDDSDSNGTKLSKVIVWLSYQPKPGIGVYVYHYDALDRITEIAYSEGDSVKGESGANYLESKKWFYNGNEQLPYKSADVNDNSVRNEMYYFYDNNGKLIRDSLFNNGIVKKYNWSTDRVLCSSGSVVLGVPVFNSDSIIINSSNYLGSIHLNNYPIGTGMPGIFFSYDNKINPLHTLNIHSAVPFAGVGGLTTAGYSENNIADISSGYFGGYGANNGKLEWQGTQTYKYNAHNLPVECVINLKAGIPQKIKFIYTN